MTFMPQNTKSWEVIKATLRYGIFWLPVILEALNQFETGGLMVALSVLLTATDKGIHESEKGIFKDLKGLLPF